MAIAVLPFTGDYELDPTHSSVQFAVEAHRLDLPRVVRRHRGTPRRRRRHDRRSTASARVESISIVDPPEFREHVVRGDDFFDADVHPELTFRSTDDRAPRRRQRDRHRRARRSAGSAAPSPPRAAIARRREDPFGTERAALELRATVDRRDWDLNWQLPLPDGGDAVGWEVELTAELELVRAA